MTRYLGGPFTPAQVRDRLAREIALQQTFGFQYWPIFLREDDAFVGCAGLRPYRVEERIPELGFHLRPEFWGRGLALEAAAAVIGHAFTALAAKALFAGHFPGNEASGRVLRKLGFAFAGMKIYPPTGVLEPSYLLPGPASPAMDG